ncbi:MAG: CapA family protein [Candidatus Pacebacteria bacterium]|nr:CapA family protein [Candidatus Paceibacterota bacterium]
MFKKIMFFSIIIAFLFLANALTFEVPIEYTIEEEKPLKILFVGDMMFDRGVEYLLFKNDFDYPFKKINLEGDIVVGNLEGPIVNQTKYISDHSMIFSFDKRIAEVLKNNNFNVLSLANNHTMNMERKGLEETKSFLSLNNIDYVGDPTYCSIDDIAAKDNIIFYAVNKTFDFNCTNEEIALNIKKIKEDNNDKFLIVLIHWGEEYVHEARENQINLAHLMIDSGADLIIGGHPHVIQNIEKYKNKLIFYSLGNFIFDQYFSKETQQGLMINLDLYDKKQIYSISIIEENKAQPEVLQDNREVLNFLFSISMPELKEEIENGEIIIYSKDQ